MINRRTFLQSAGAALAAAAGARAARNGPVNVVLITADDLGYGDLGCYGSSLPTPNLDALANQGVRFTQFYAPSPVCSPSRAGLLTGRYGLRSGVPRVLDAAELGGLAENETTIAKMLKPLGYRTMCVGKWHLGRPNKYLPTSHGFDSYYGIPYSNDMNPTVLLRNTEVIEQPVKQATLIQRYTDEAVSFIRRSADAPFFLYMPHNAPHIPLVPGANFAGASGAGKYGDIMEELDWSVGEVMAALRTSGAEDNTLVIFTSDNGPWFQGSAGRLRGRKGETFEGGMRVPCIAHLSSRFPAIPPSQRRGARGSLVVNSFATQLDILPTIAALTGAPLPSLPLDGVDISPVLAGAKPAVDRPLFLYFNSTDLQAVRRGQWKLHVARNNAQPYTGEPKTGSFNLRLVNPELYNVDLDQEEASDVALQYPNVVKALQDEITRLLPTLPQEVQDDWRDTQQRPVQPNESGQRPRPIVP